MKYCISWLKMDTVQDSVSEDGFDYGAVESELAFDSEEERERYIRKNLASLAASQIVRFTECS